MQEINREEGLFFRQTLFNQAERIVVKVGSAVLTGDNGLNEKVILGLAKQLSFLTNSGREVILVSSGAVAAGRRKIKFNKDSCSLEQKQALAAIGQGLLMQSYEHAFAEHDQHVAQLLLTHGDLSERDRYINVKNTVETLFSFGVIPIINENDTVSTEELRFGDNDTLGALIANMVGANMYIILTDVDCLYSSNPDEDDQAEPIYTVSEINEEIKAVAGESSSSVGTGGMFSKVRAAAMVTSCGGSVFIAPGKNPQVLQDLFSGEQVGTFFLPMDKKNMGKKQWIAQVLKPKGYLVLDAGARKALLKDGKSLLPVGVTEVRGSFLAGDPVHCLDTNDKPIAAGLSNYSSQQIDMIKGCRSEDITDRIGGANKPEVIHRDNLALLSGCVYG